MMGVNLKEKSVLRSSIVMMLFFSGCTQTGYGGRHDVKIDCKECTYTNHDINNNRDEDLKVKGF